MNDAQMGDIRSSIFSSSTCVTVQILHEHFGSMRCLSVGGSTMAALSRNLKNTVIRPNFCPNSTFSVPEGEPVSSYRSELSSGNCRCHFLTAATTTWQRLVSGLTPSFLYLYTLEPAMNTARLKTMSTVGIAKLTPHPTLSCSQTSTVPDSRELALIMK